MQLAEEAPNNEYGIDNSFEHHGIEQGSLSEPVEEFAKEINSTADEKHEEDYSLSEGFLNLRAPENQNNLLFM